MLNKNDPLIGAVKQVMTQSDNERAAVKAVNEKFGVQDRKALPWQKQSEWDAAYKKVLSEGVSVLNEETQLDEISTKLARNYIKKANDQRSSGKLTIRQAGKRTDGVELATRKLTGAGGYPRAKVLTKEEQIDEIADTARGKERVRLAVHRADATVVDSAINPPRSKKGKREAKNAMKTIDRGIAVHKKKGGVLDSYLKRAYGLKKEENVNQQPSIESIHEEIAHNLYEQASYILENYGEEGLVQFFEALTEEEVAIFEANQAGTPAGDNVRNFFSRMFGGASPSREAAWQKSINDPKVQQQANRPVPATTAAAPASTTNRVSGPVPGAQRGDRAPGTTGTSNRNGSTGGSGNPNQAGQRAVTPPKPTPNPSQNMNKPESTPAPAPAPAAAAAAKAKSNRTKAASKTVSGSATKKSGLKAPGVKAVRKAPAGLRPQSRSVRDGLASDWRE